MTRNRQIYQSAKVLIDNYGDDGAIDHCDSRIIRLIDEDDTDGAVIWKGDPYRCEASARRCARA